MVLYFGFGANRDIEMIRAITSRSAIGVPAMLHGYHLCVESFKNIPVRARRILAEQWDEMFVSYGIICDPETSVYGTLWLLTDRQRVAVLKWELEGLWSHNICDVPVTIDLFGISIPVRAVSEELRHQNVQLVDDKNYETFIVPKERILKVAELTR